MMNQHNLDHIIVFSSVIFSIIGIFSGMLCVYLGYKLFIKGIWGDSGDFKAAFDKKKLIITNAAPGTFFTLFGCSCC